MRIEISQPSLIQVDCTQCWDTGLAPKPSDRGRCPACSTAPRAANAAASLLARAIHRRLDAEQTIEERPFQLACLLTHFSTKRPIKRAPLQEMMELGEREFKKQIEILRRDWVLPIGSRKGTPNGYWIITSEADFQEWHRHFRRQALTEFATANQLMEQNFPALAKRQAELAAHEMRWENVA
jgi:hypothetical protein